jgi:branched-chain amino acid transport system substrate-binding protein
VDTAAVTWLGRGALATLLAGAWWLGGAIVAMAQPPLRVGATVAQTGTYALLGQNQLRGVQLCVKHANEKGGVLGRRVELLVEDDQSEPANAARIYEKLIAQDKVDAVLGPYSSPITEAVAQVTERHRMAMVAPGAAASSIFRKRRKFIFMVYPPAEIYLEGLIDMAAKRGLKTLALVHEDSLFPRSIAEGARELAKKRGLAVVAFEAYPAKTSNFTSVVSKVKATNPDALGAATYFDDAVAIVRHLREVDVNPKMVAMTSGADLPRFYEALGRNAEFVYGATLWEPDLAHLVRSGTVIPLARRYPGVREFVEAYQKEFPGADLSYHSASGYTGCQVLVEAIRRARSVDGAELRATILAMELPTAFGGFKVDQDGIQVARTMLMVQWLDGKKALVWPEEIAVAKPRFPTPPWSQR